MNYNDLIDDYQSAGGGYKDLLFPLDFEFKITTLHNDFLVKDRAGNVQAYVRQKMLRLKEKVEVYTNDSMKELEYKIQADRWIDFNAHYSFLKADGSPIGSMGRKGMKSIWKATYNVYNVQKEHVFTIREENPWAKVGDSFLGEIPVLSLLTGYLFHPKYVIIDQNDQKVARLSKQNSFFGRKFKLEKLQDIAAVDQLPIMLSTMMMILMERQRG